MAAWAVVEAAAKTLALAVTTGLDPLRPASRTGVEEEGAAEEEATEEEEPADVGISQSHWKS